MAISIKDYVGGFVFFSLSGRFKKKKWKTSREKNQIVN